MRTILTIMTLLLTCNAATAQERPTDTTNNVAEYTAKAKQALDHKDFDNATSWYKKAAELGDVSSMYELGQIYSAAYGVDKYILAAPSGEAENWYLKAANQGNAPAMYQYGFIIFNRGFRTPVNEASFKEALPWFQRSADFGYPPAMTQLGVMYSADGSEGVPEDHAKAAQLYMKAAQMGNAQAMNQLGYVYSHGIGVPRDIDKAVYWWRKAVETDPNGPIGKAAQSWLD